MRRLTGFGVSALLLLFLGTAVPTYALQGHSEQHSKSQEKHQGKTKKQQGQKNKQPSRTPQQGRQPTSRPPQQGQRQAQRPQTQQPRTTQRRQPAYRPSEQARRVEPSQQRGVWQERRAQNWQSQHRTWQQRGGYHGYYIPSARYHSYFGPSHRFRVYGLPLVVVSGYPRFEYRGYWISFLDPWPQFWPYDWYETDDVYIVFMHGGYYLTNVRYPQYRIAVAIYLH